MHIRPWDSLWSWQRKKSNGSKLPAKICRVALDHFPECENSKKKCLQPNHHLLCSMKHSVTVGKKKLSNSIKEVRIPSDSCWQLVYPQSNRHASFDCWNTTSRKFIACRTTSWELGFPIAKSFAGSRNLIQIRAEHEAGLHSLSESPFTWMNLNPNQQDSMLHKPLNVLDFVRMPRPSKNTKVSNINTKTIKNCTTTSWWFEKETYQTYLHNQLVLSIASSMLQPFKSFT